MFILIPQEACVKTCQVLARNGRCASWDSRAFLARWMYARMSGGGLWNACELGYHDTLLLVRQQRWMVVYFSSKNDIQRVSPHILSIHIPPCSTSFRPLPFGLRSFLTPFHFLQTLSPSLLLVLPSCNTLQHHAASCHVPPFHFLRASNCFLTSFLLRFLSPSQPVFAEGQQQLAVHVSYLPHSHRMWSGHEMIFPCFFSPPCLPSCPSPRLLSQHEFSRCFSFLLLCFFIHISFLDAAARLPSYLSASLGWSKFRVRNYRVESASQSSVRNQHPKVRISVAESASKTILGQHRG